MIDAHGEHQPAEQARRDIVDVGGAARDDLALHGELQQLQARHGLLEQRVGGDHGRHRGGGRTAHTGSERNALLDVEFEPEVQTERRVHRLHARVRPCCASGSTGRSSRRRR